MVAAMFIGHLSRTRLATNLELLATSLLAKAGLVVDHAFQDLMDVLQRAGLADVFLDDFHGELLECHAILLNLTHEAWFHHASVVGDGIIEGEGIDGWYLRFITDAHPRQCRLTPVAAVCLRTSHTWEALSLERQGEGYTDTFTIEPIDILLGMVEIVLVDDAADTNVGGKHQALIHRDTTTITATAPVVILHHTTVHQILSVAHLHAILARHHSVLQRYHDGGCLEGGAGFPEVGDGIVLHLGIVVVARRSQACHIGDGFHVARGHFHQHHDANLAVDFLQLTHNHLLGSVLHPDIDGRNDVEAIDGFYISAVCPLFAHFLTMHLSVHTTQDAVVSQFQTVHRRVTG